jgi:hypothetical protein
MKYSQFLDLGNLLESNKTDLDSWKKTKDIRLVQEADEPKDLDTLDTQKSIKGTGWITKKGRMRKSLNKQAKKLMDGINQNVANKFLKPIKDLKVQVYKKMAEVGKGKQPKEIVGALKVDLQNIQKVQTKQMEQITKYAQNAIDVNTKKINGAIEKKELKDTNTAELQTYWGLLTTQIMMNLLQKINVEDDNTIGEVIKDEGILKAAKQINAALNKPQKKKEDELKAQIEKLKGEIKAKDEAEAKTEETPTEEVAPAAEPEKTETK